MGCLAGIFAERRDMIFANGCNNKYDIEWRSYSGGFG